MKTTEACDHCPKCLSSELWDVSSEGIIMGLQCQDCGFTFRKEEAVRGVDIIA